MYFLTLPGAVAVIAMAVATCSTANATLLTFSDRATFLAALSGVAESESFEDEAIDVSLGSRTIATSSSDIEFTGSASATFGVNDLVAGGRGPTDGTRYLQVGFIATSSVRFQFATPLLAFGIDVVDKNVNDLDGIIDDQTINNAISPGGEGNVQFWGVVAFHICNHWPQFGVQIWQMLEEQRYAEVQQGLVRVLLPYYTLWHEIEQQYAGDGYLDKLCMELVGLDSSRCRPPTRDIRDQFREKARRMLLECGTPNVI